MSNTSQRYLDPVKAAEERDNAIRAMDLDQLRTEISRQLLAAVSEAAVLAALADTHQRGSGFVDLDTKTDRDQMVRQEKHDRRARLAAGDPVGTGATPAPGNISALSAWNHTDRVIRWAIRWLTGTWRRAGVCVWPAYTSEGDTLQIRCRHVRLLVMDHTSRGDLIPVVEQLDRALDAIRLVLDGATRAVLGGRCMHCGVVDANGHGTLVYYGIRADDGREEHVIRCEKTPAADRREPCWCADPLCMCKEAPVAYRHTWHQNTPSGKDSWTHLAAVLTRQNDAAEPHATSTKRTRHRNRNRT